MINGLERFLSLEPRSRILDLACGEGRQTLELARRGHRVLGLDCSEEALRRARQAAKHERLNVHFLKSDIRRIPYNAEFDAAVGFFSPLGEFPLERDDLRALESVRKALKSRGFLLLDLPNRERVLRHGPAGSFDLETGRLEGRRLYALTEIKGLLERAGLIYLRVWGAWSGSAYERESRRMIVLAEKPAPRPAPRREEEGLATALRIKGRRR